MINPYKEMNDKIVETLQKSDDFVRQYAAARILELEERVRDLENEIEEIKNKE